MDVESRVRVSGTVDMAAGEITTVAWKGNRPVMIGED